MNDFAQRDWEQRKEYMLWLNRAHVRDIERECRESLADAAKARAIARDRPAPASKLRSVRE